MAGTAREDIAIVGVGCRFPGGVRDAEALWRVFAEGRDMTAPVPADRWGARFHDADRRPGTTYCGRGAFLEDVDRFDAGFFGITAREADEMDPQQRLLLETAWAAMEDSGTPRDSWNGTRTGVYAGILAMDYTVLHAKTLGVEKIDPYYASGKEFSFGAGRIAYTFGLHGPCVTVNSACSSSLMAVHLACQALRSGECDAAVAAGVNVMLTPELSVFMSKIEALSPSSKCRPFDAAADGVTRGEGCGAVVLRRLSDAVRDGDRIWAVVRGSAANHDGRSAGLTAPNPVAQEALLREAWHNAGVSPAKLGYVEAHGTGTPLGDPIELSALSMAAAGHRTPGRPLFVGSHKANFGHLDSAAGMLGLLKAVLVALHREVPPQIGVERPTPMIDWSRSGLAVATEPKALPARGPVFAGVSAFGLSGSNCHVVVESPPAGRRVRRGGSPPVPVRVLTVSGPTPEALAGQLAAYRDVLADADDSTLPDLLYSAAVRRTHHPYRLAVPADDRDGLLARLASLAADAEAGVLVDGRPPRVVHRFDPELSADWAGFLGRWRWVGAVGEVCAEHPGWKESPAVAALAGPVALAKLWSAWGLAPSIVVGAGPGADGEHPPAAAEIPAGAFVVPIDPAELERTLAAAYQTSLTVDWAAVFGSGHRYTPLPPVALAGRRHWLPGVEPGQQGGIVGGLESLRAEVRLLDADGRPVAAFGVGSPVTAIAGPGPVAAKTPAVPTPAPAPAPIPAPSPARAPSLTRDQVAARVGAVAAEILGLEPGRHVPRARGFYELGMGSFTLAEFSRRLHGEFGVEVDESAGIDHPTVERMTDFLVAALAAMPAGSAVAPAVADAGVAVAEPAAAAEPGRSAAPAVDEPVAIVGMACRLPGAESLDAFWTLLRDQVDATGEVPAERWDAAELPVGPGGVPGTVATGRGAFLGDVAGFDNAFFRVSAREARAMDPQQRLFLEVAWEALDDAGLDAHGLRGGATGLFVGLNTTDYQQLVTRHRENVDLYYGTGNSFSGTAGRLSYFLGVHGPSLAVDTACSSSLAAVHLACQSLRGGESTVAVAGGVNVIATPTVYLAMSAGGALAPDGRCKTFDAAADGYGRGEGAVALVLKTLSRARADGDRVYALIRGSAVNHNGASGGLTVPDGGAQQEVIASALARAGVDAAAVGYVEAHGTGTPLGDRVELGALAAALAPGRPADRPLLVGSVKTNIGHLEAAAGAAGLAKTVLALRHGEIPAQINCPQPTSRPGVAVAVRPTPWPTDRRLAGVSAFGFTGTNAHVVIEAPDGEDPASSTREVSHRPLVLALSATTPAALAAAATRMRERLAEAADEELADLCYTTGARRTHWEYRAAAVGSDRAELDRGLAAVVDGLAAARSESVAGDGAALTAGRRPLLGRARPGEPARLVLVYGDELGRADFGSVLAEEPVARAAFDEVDREARAILGRPVGTADRDPVAVFAVQTALTALWRGLGLRADAFAGRGLGEVAAAHAAGALSLRDALLAASGVGGARLEAAGRPLRLDSLVGGDDWSPPSAAGSREWDPQTAAALAPAGTETVALDVAFGPGAGRLAALAGAELTAAEADAPVGTVARLHVAGVAVDWTALHGGRGRVVSLPAYPWQRERHWIDVSALSDGSIGHASGHPYLASRFSPAELPGRTYFTARVPGAAATVGLPWLAEALLGAARTVVGGPVRVEGLRLRVPVVTAADAATTQIVADRRGAEWRLTVVGALAAEVTVRRTTATAGTGGPTGRHLIPPAVLDAALRTLTDEAAEPRFVVGVDAIEWRADVQGEVRFDARGTEQGGDVSILSQDGTPLVVLEGIRLAPQSAHVLPPERRERLENRLYDVHWRRLDARFEAAQAIEGPWLVRSASPEALPAARSVVAALRAAGADAGFDHTTDVAAVVLVTAGAQDPGEAVAALMSAARDDQTDAPLWLVAGPEDQPAQAAVWSVGRVLAMEAPNRWAGMVGVADDPDLGEVALRLLAAPPPADADREDELRLRDGEWYAPRLARAEALPPVLAAPQLDPERWYVLTDALAAYNAPILEWLVEHGARAILDVPTADHPADRGEALAAHGVTLRTATVQAIAAAAATEADPDLELAGVILTAAPGATRALPDSDPAGRIREAEAMLALDRLTRAQPRPPEFFHIIGSAAAAWGTVGTAEQAALEGIADAVAAARRRDRQPAGILRCMPRADSGELSSRDRVLMAECGLRPLTAADVAEAFDVLARTHLTPATAMLADVDEPAYVRACRTATRRAWLAEFATAKSGAGDAADPGSRTPLAIELAALPEARRADRLADLVLDAVADVLGAGSSPDPRQGFFDMGMDSVMSLALRNRLADILAVDLPPTLTFEFPTPAALVEHLTDELVRPDLSSQTSDTTTAGDESATASKPPSAATPRPPTPAETSATGAKRAEQPQPPSASPETPPDYDELSDPALLGRLTDLLASSEALLAQEGGAW